MNFPARITASEAGRVLAQAKTPRDRLEAKIQEAFTEWCRLCLGDDVLWFSIPNEGAKEKAAPLIAMGMRPGAADFCLIHKGCTVFIEFKRPKSRGKTAGVQSPEQVAFQANAERAGAFYFVARSSVQAREFIASLGFPHREVV